MSPERVQKIEDVVEKMAFVLKTFKPFRLVMDSPKLLEQAYSEAQLISAFRKDPDSIPLEAVSMNPLRGKMCLPLDCADWQAIEWTEPITRAAHKPKRSFADFQKSLQAAEVLPEPLEFKSLADTLNDLVAKVRSFRRPCKSAGGGFVW